MVFSEDKSKIKIYPKKSKRVKEFTNEYVYLTFHSLTDSSMSLSVYFECWERVELGKQGINVTHPMFKSMNKSIKEKNDKFLDDLMKNPQERREYMRSIQQIKIDRVKRLKKSNTCRYELQNKSKALLKLIV